MKPLLLAAALLVACTASQPRPDASVQTPNSAAFAAFADSYFDAGFAFSPSDGTGAGFHQYDAQLEDRSAARIEARNRELHAQREQLAALVAKGLSGSDAVDAALIASAIDSELLDRERLQTWRHNPISYVGLPGGAIDILMKRAFAPAPERLRAVVARLRGVPALLQALRDNVREPPQEWTDLALRVASGSAGFFRDTTTAWARGAGADPALLAEFEQVNTQAALAMEATGAWLKSDLLPRSTGKYALGAELFLEKLRLEEMVDLPLDKLLAIGEANLAKDHQAFLDTATQIDAARPAAEVMSRLSLDHPTPETLLSSTRATLEGTRQYLLDHHLVSVPSEVRPLVAETPPYARVGSFASMDTPGPFEKPAATEAFYYVTPPEKDWDAEHVEEHLRSYNRVVMELTTIHEAFPGHYLQYLNYPRFPSKTRKLVLVASNVEGWAHYTEQMMIDEGYGDGDPKLRLAQLSEALLRDCRYVAGIKMHTQGMTVEQGAKCFTDNFQEPANAYEEARRGTYNPTYLYYTLGKLQILKLREDLKKKQGKEFSLQSFHTTFLEQGGLPIKLMRQLLLPGDTEPSL